jgi:hypothetical protein
MDLVTGQREETRRRKRALPNVGGGIRGEKNRWRQTTAKINEREA